MTWHGAWDGAWQGGWHGALDTDAPAVIPSTTTWPTIRDYWLTLLSAITPTVLPSFKFRKWEANERSFFAWAEASGGEVFRIFDVTHDHAYQDGGQFYNSTANEIGHTATVWMAYPRQRDLFGERLDDILDADLHDISRTLGLRRSYRSICSGLCSAKREFSFRELGEAAIVLGVQFRLQYDRTIP